MQYLSDENCVCITTSKGDVLLIDMQQTSLECVGSVDDGLVTSLWSPDYELLVLVTGINWIGNFFNPWDLFKHCIIRLE